MAEYAKEIKRWLDTVIEENPDAVVGVDDGGLCLVVEDSEAYYEIGGMPLPDDD